MPPESLGLSVSFPVPRIFCSVSSGREALGNAREGGDDEFFIVGNGRKIPNYTEETENEERVYYYTNGGETHLIHPA